MGTFFSEPEGCCGGGGGMRRSTLFVCVCVSFVSFCMFVCVTQSWGCHAVAQSDKPPPPLPTRFLVWMDDMWISVDVFIPHCCAFVRNKVNKKERKKWLWFYVGFGPYVTRIYVSKSTCPDNYSYLDLIISTTTYSNVYIFFLFFYLISNILLSFLPRNNIVEGILMPFITPHSVCICLYTYLYIYVYKHSGSPLI